MSTNDFFTMSSRQQQDFIEKGQAWNNEIRKKLSKPRTPKSFSSNLTKEEKQKLRKAAEEKRNRLIIESLAERCESLYFLYLLNRDTFLSAIAPTVRREIKEYFQSFSFFVDFIDGKDFPNKIGNSNDLIDESVLKECDSDDLTSEVQIYLQPTGEDKVYTFSIHFFNWRQDYMSKKPLNFVLQKSFSASAKIQFVENAGSFEEIPSFDGCYKTVSRS